jgi:DNA polymerase-3 subunit gamma/tau
MGQALYRKYRSKSLREIVGQEHITKTLEQALKQGKISHAYLFTGPRGVGKTSIARILAHEINGLPYEDDSPHMDIIEIDAASNRRIDEIRELRDKIYVAPTSLQYKVYIIDEVHMLTKEAFNALLKTLEEPPAHAVFILATTDAHKLPDTIISRTQRFTFKPVAAAEVAAHLADIAKKEKIKISPEALELLAQHGEGSFRDSISLLDQLGSHDKSIGVDDVQKMLGVPPIEAIDGLLKKLGGNNQASALMISLDALFAAGFQAAAIAKQLGYLLRRQLVAGETTLTSERTLDLLGELIKVAMSHDPERFLEITLLQVIPPEVQRVIGQDKEPEPLETDDPIVAEPVPEPPIEDVPKSKPAAKKEAAEAQVKPNGSAAFDEAVWPAFLQTLKQKHNTLYGVVRMARPAFLEDDTLELAFAFAFHEKRIKESSNRQKLADVIYGLTGKNINVECRLDAAAKPPKVSLEVKPEPRNDAPNTELVAISNIFGTAELLES